MIVTFVWAPSFGQTPLSANLQVGHDSWTFQDGAPEEIYALARTDDGFLWLGTETGLVHFDGLRFEPFRSPFGDQLLSTAVYALFAPPSGGLWIGYRFGGFSFVDHGRVTNYETQLGSPTRTVWGLAQHRDGIVWAATATGLRRFSRGLWEHIGAEWNAPKNALCIGFDSEGILWALSGPIFAPLDLVYLMPGTTEFTVTSRNLVVEGFTLSPDGKVVTELPPNSLKGNSFFRRPVFTDHSVGVKMWAPVGCGPCLCSRDFGYAVLSSAYQSS